MQVRRARQWLRLALTPSLLASVALLSGAVAVAADDSVTMSDGGPLGSVLADASGMTLYTWDRDDPKSPTVAVNASATWPPLIVSASPTGPAGLPGILGTATKLDGTLQATYNGWPLYYFINDRAPGQTLGDGVGGIWHAIPLAMDMMMATTVDMRDTSLGSTLTDSAGMTLYTWDRDDPKSPTVAVNASATWPPLIVSASPTGPAGLPGILGTATKLDGTLQATYNGWPLYYFINDRAPGQTLGDGVGGIWHAIPLAMDMMMATTVDMRDTTLGSTLTDSAGMTLYTWDRDERGSPTVAVNASATWPPLIASASPTGPAGLPGALGTATKLDGTLQVTFNGWPLYYYINDKAPGQTLGDGVGGIWHAIPLAMDMAVAPAASVAVATSPTAAAGANSLGTISHPDRGQVLTDANGKSLYVLSQDRDNDNKSICYREDGCADYWPPVIVQGVPVAQAGIPGTLGTQQRADSTMQLTYNGRPLYSYIVDQKPGDFTGDRITDDWGNWFLVPVQ